MDAKIARVQSAHAMKRIAVTIASLGVAAGCQRSAGTAPAVSEAYRLDIATLCDVITRSGADQVPRSERAVRIAVWLAPNLQTAEAHDYLVKIGPLVGEAKAAALEAEAARVGLARCALADEWRAPAHSP
jgi:hypothetical protein